MNIRERTEEIERITLSTYASLAENSSGRLREEPQCDMRTVYQRDRDRIIHCKAFRRLKHKTQVYLAPEGDHYRTRLTHTLEVAQIARTIARSLRVNEDLAEAIALGHDLGHTPFGHAGERALNDVAKDGFRHYEQSLRVVDKLENSGRGLNLSFEVRDGILCHTKGVEAKTLEGRIVRMADRIAYMNHDIDDSIRAGVLTEDDIPPDISAVLGVGHSKRIDTLIHSVVNNSKRGKLKMDGAVAAAYDALHDFLYDAVYRNPYVKSEEIKAEQLIKELFEYYLLNPERLPQESQETVRAEGEERAITDYIAGMSDRFAIGEFKSISIPRSWEVL